MSTVSRWISGAIAAAVGLVALFLASRATEDVMYYTGLAVFLASVFYNYYQVHKHYDKSAH